MHTLSDRDVAYDLLYGCKSTSHMYMQAVLESANTRCREVFHRIHDDGLRSQWRIWRFLHSRDEYQTETAQRSEVDSVRQRMEHLCQTHDAVRPQYAATGAREAEGRWEGNRPEEGRWNEGGNLAYSGAARGGYGSHFEPEPYDGPRRTGAWSDGGYGDRARTSSLGMAGNRPGNSLTAPWGERHDRENGSRRGAEGSYGDSGGRRTTATAPRY